MSTTEDVVVKARMNNVTAVTGPLQGPGPNRWQVIVSTANRLNPADVLRALQRCELLRDEPASMKSVRTKAERGT